MGCTVSNLDSNVCLKDETPEMHQSYIDKNGLSRYYKAMGMSAPQKDTEMEDNSENLNIGLINMEEKNSTSYEFYGIRPSDLLEICLGIIVILYISKLVYKYIRKRKRVAKINKNMELKELIQEAATPQATSPPAYSHPQSTPMSKTPIQFAIQAMHENNSKAVVPIFSNALYD